jgi:ATP phosphoribosyltransferase
MNPPRRNEAPLTLALPKGRLFDRVLEHLEARGLKVRPQNRELVVTDAKGTLKIFLVKNSDLPVYVSHGIAGLGVCGSDVLYEAGSVFFELLEFPFGGTKMCLAAREDQARDTTITRLKVATKFPVFTRNFFHLRGIPVEIIKLHGSVELAPVLGLAPYIVDLVETGSTLKANKLRIVEELEDIKVKLIANPAYYKVHYKAVDIFTAFLKEPA